MSTNLRRKALLPAIAMVLVSVIALSSVTFAWFTMSNTASVENLNVQVTEAKGIQISLDAENWASQFTAADITEKAYGGNANQMPEGKIFPVSTNGGVTDGKMAMYYGELLANNNLKITKLTDTAGKTGNYIAFDLFFKMAEDTTVSLDTVSKIVDSNNKGSDQSARVAFIYNGVATSAGEAIALNGAQKTVIWEPNAKDSSYNGLKQATDDAGVATVNNYVPEGDYAAGVTTVEDASDISFDFKAGINKLRIYIWMEGQDINCVNASSGGYLATTLQFVQPEKN